MDDITDIRDMYNSAWDREDNRLGRHQLERDMTWRYLEMFLPPKGRILEIGAGTGRYTLELATRGYNVLAMDLSPELVARATRRASEFGLGRNIEFRVGDARDLSAVPKGMFDAALLMGPLYHLVLREDRLSALNWAYTCLKPGGLVFSALLSRFGILGNLLKVKPGLVHEELELSSWLESGQDTDGYCRRAKDNFRSYGATVGEVAPLHTEAGFQMLTLAGVEPAISADDESYNRLRVEDRRLWLDLLFRISTESGMIASSRHLLYIGRKPAA